MDATVAALVVALVAVLAFTGLLWRSQNQNAAAKASIKFGELFSADVELSPRNETRAKEAIREAERLRGIPAASPTTEVERVQNHTDHRQLTRILWVDDHPGNNVYETIALENLGRFVTAATSTEAGLLFLRELECGLAITDVARENNLSAGEEFIRRARAAGHKLPIVVYTSNAAGSKKQLLAAGADAVVDLPGDLFREIDRLVARSPALARST